MRNIAIYISTVAILFIAIAIFTFSTTTDDKPQKSYYETYKTDYKVFNPPMPTMIDLAGEKAPLNLYFVSEKLEKEILKNAYWHSNTLLLFKRANRWFPIIEPILEKNNIPNDFKYLALIESGLENVVSPAGARGFWQFMTSTAKEYNLTVNKDIDERYNVEKATQAACEYLNDAYKRFGNWTLVAASYNRGMSGIQKQLNAQKVDNYYDLSLNSETARYVYRILSIKAIFEQPSKYGFQLREVDLFPPLETYTVAVDSSVTSWGDFAENYNISYGMLKELNPWLRRSSLNNSSARTYNINLPMESMSNYEAMKHKLKTALGVFGEEK